MTSFESPEWPASPDQLTAARQFLKSISTKPDDRPVLILPDRDVDGLTSGGIMHRVVSRILLKDRNVECFIRFVPKGANISDPSEKAEIDAVNARYSFKRFGLIQSRHSPRSRISRIPSNRLKCTSAVDRPPSVNPIPRERNSVFSVQSPPRRYHLTVNIHYNTTLPHKRRSRNHRTMSMARGTRGKRRPGRLEMGSPVPCLPARPRH